MVLFSGERAPDAELGAAAERLSGTLGVLVLVADVRDYLRRVEEGAPPDARCLYLGRELEGESRRIQSRYGKSRYFSPVLAGTGLGGAVALLALSQASAATIAGAASDGFAILVPTRRPLCPGAPAEPAEGGFRYGATDRWPGFVRVAPRAGAEEEAARAFVAASGLEAGEAILPPGDIAAAPLADRLLALLQPPIRSIREAVSPVGGLPLVELPVRGRPGRFMAVVLSGDGGWRDLDKRIAEHLQAQGVPVVGLDSLRYFWSEKPPDRLAADLAAVIDHYRGAWGRPEVLLIGYSFGADVLPLAVNRLPPELRDGAVRQISLLGLSRSADFEIHVSGWVLSGPTEDSLPTLPELARLDLSRVQCVYGREEEGTACPDPALDGAERIATAGGHHFDGDYAALARAILAGAERRG